LPNVRHAPFREAPELTLKIVADFINRLFRDHHEGEKTRPIQGLRRYESIMPILAA